MIDREAFETRAKIYIEYLADAVSKGNTDEIKVLCKGLIDLCSEREGCRETKRVALRKEAKVDGTAKRISKHMQIVQALKAVEWELEGLDQLANELRDGPAAVERPMEKSPENPKGVPPISLVEFLDTTPERVMAIAECLCKIRGNMKDMLL